MLCKKPFVKGAMSHGCGQCTLCRVNKKRQKCHRMLFESLKHEELSFVTLTYSDEYLPPNSTLVPSDAQKFLKRLRKAVYPKTIRYLLVGEYGDESQRPHYHLALFGHPGCRFVGSSARERRRCVCDSCSIIRKAWNSPKAKTGGHTDCAWLEPDSALYIAGYVTKKMTHKEGKCTSKCTHPPLNGRHPEFARPSLRPGLGADAMDEIAEALSDVAGTAFLERNHDVPHTVNIGPKTVVLDGYLRRKLREKLGFTEEAIANAKEKRSLEMLILREENQTVAKAQGVDFYKKLQEEKNQKILNIEAKLKIFTKKDKLL